MRDADWTRILGWPGYRVYRHEINEQAKTLKLWVRRKRGNRKLVCSGCGRRVEDVHEVYEREVRDLPCFEFRTTVVIELYRVRCPDCGIRTEKVHQLPSKAPFSKRFEDIVGQACECASARQRSFQKLAVMLLDHLEGILNYCNTKVPLGVVEAINGNIKSLLRRGRGYKNLEYLLLKAQRMAATKTEFVAFRRAA